MTAPIERHENSAEDDRIRFSDAVQSYMIQLGKLLGGSLEALERVEGNDEYGYVLRVPAARYGEMNERAAALSQDIVERFGVRITTLVVPA